VFSLINAAAWLREVASAQQANRLVNFTIAGMRALKTG
jgi:hypothetical protein